MRSDSYTTRTSRPESSGRPGGAPVFEPRFVAPLLLGSALNPVNSSLIATALVPIAADLHVPAGTTSALVAALYLASAVAQPTAGKAADLFGPRRVFLAGIVLVGAGGLVGATAITLVGLILSRVLIGVGTSCAYPTAMVLIRRRATAAGLEKPPGGVLGGLQIAGVATASLGLPIGGVLVEFVGWRSVFFVNLPIALLTFIVTLWGIPRDETLGRQSVGARLAALDVAGILGFAAAMTALLLFLFALPTAHWWLLAVSVALWVAEVVWERRAHRPFLDIRLLAGNAPLSRTYLRFGLVFLCSYLVLYGVTQWVQAVRGLSALAAGLLLLPMTVVSGLVVPPIARRNLVRGPLVGAAVGCLVAGGLALLLPSGAWLVLTVVVTVLLGGATGAATSNSIALYRQAPAEQTGTASGLMRSAGYLGSIASSAVTGVVFGDHVSDAGVVVIASIMLGAGVVLLLLTALDRDLRSAATT